MTSHKFRWLGFGLLATAGAGVLAAESMLNAAFAFGDDGTALIMGYALAPTPIEPYETNVINDFIDPATPLFPGQPVFSGYSPLLQYTPETDYGQGLTTGVSDLNSGITSALANGNVVVFGYSESASVAAQELANLDALPAGQQFNPNDLQFVLVDSLNNPNGGFFERFPYLDYPSQPAIPADSPYPTDVYTIEYSGAADVPQYLDDPLADLNAMAGFTDLHPFLLPDYPTTFNPAEIAQAVAEPVSPGDTSSEYFMIPTQNLPLLDLVRIIPGVGPAMADLVQPDLRVLVDMGYDWTEPADVDTAAEFTSPPVDESTISALLSAGAQQGMTAAMVDLGLLPQSDMPDVYPFVPDISGLQSGLLDSSLPASAAADSSGALLTDLNTDVSGVTAELSALLGPGAPADLSALFSADLSSITELFTNPLGFLGI